MDQPAEIEAIEPENFESVQSTVDTILAEIKHEVAIAPNPVVGYTPRPALVAEVVQKHPQITVVNFAGLDDDIYFIELKGLIKRSVQFNVPLIGTPNTLGLGATGIVGGEFNVIPKSFRRYVDAYESGNSEETARTYRDLKMFARFVSRWSPAYPRWIKMALKVFKLPGGEGGLREPYKMPNDDEVKEFTEGVLRLRIPEIDELARAANLKLPD